MKCYVCDNELYEHEFLSLRKYKNPEKKEGLETAVDFCSVECVNKFIDADTTDVFKESDVYKISRCGAYKDCERLDNLRKKCEGVDLLSVLSYVPSMATLNHCDSGEVGIIKSSVKLMDLLDSFDRKYQQSSDEMLSHSKNMNRLTKWILGFTVANLIFLIVSIIILVIRP